MGIIASDTFTDTNGMALESHVSDSAHGWVKRTHLGSTQFFIQSNACLHSSGDVLDLDGYHIDVEPTDDAYESMVDAKQNIALTSQQSRIKLGVRFNPDPAERDGYTFITYYRQGNSESDSICALWKLINGVGVELLASALVPQLQVDTFYRFRFATRLTPGGDVVLEGYIDDVLYVTATDDGADKMTIRGRATIGDRRGATSVQTTFDNYVLQTIPATPIDGAEHAQEAVTVTVTVPPGDAEHAQEATAAAAVIAPEDAEHAHEATQSEPTAEGDIDSAEHAHEAGQVAVTATVNDSEHLHEADQIQAKTAHDSEHAHEAGQVAVTATVDSAEHLHEADEVAKRTPVDSSEHFHEVTQAHPVVEAGIRIAVDRLEAAAVRYSFGVGEREQNIVQGSLEPAELQEQERLVKNMTAFYRYDSRAGDFLQKDLTMQANEFGADAETPMRFVNSHDTAARVLDYLRKDERARAGQLRFEGKKIVKARKNLRLRVQVPSYGIESDWQVMDYRTLQEAYAFRVKRYLEEKYTYEPPEELPVDESLPELTIFGDTPPFPIANFTVATHYEIKPDQSVEVYMEATWSPPEENYSETRIYIRKTGDVNWQEAGRGFDRAILSGFVPGTSYDVRGVPYNLAGTTPGLERIVSAVVAGADLTNPATPTGLAGSSKHGLVSFTWDRHTDPQVMGFHIRFWTASTGGSMIVPPGMKYVRQPEDVSAKPQFEFQRQKADLTTTLQTWAEVRAVKYNGRVSAYTSRQSATTTDIKRLDVKDGEINSNVSGGGDSGITLGTGMTQLASASKSFVAGQTVYIHASFTVQRTGGASPPGNDYLFWELQKDGGAFKGIFPIGGLSDGNSKNISASFDDEPGAGSHTYRIRARNTTHATPIVQALLRKILVTEKKR